MRRSTSQIGAKVRLSPRVIQDYGPMCGVTEDEVLTVRRVTRWRGETRIIVETSTGRLFEAYPAALLIVASREEAEAMDRAQNEASSRQMHEKQIHGSLSP